VGLTTIEVEPVITGLLELASLLHHLVCAENVTKGTIVRSTAQAVATLNNLSDDKAVSPAAKKVVPNTGRCSSWQLHLGTADPIFEKVVF
jgi:hypothetical protein